LVPFRGLLVHYRDAGFAGNKAKAAILTILGFRQSEIIEYISQHSLFFELTVCGQ
jgi:hypothetical protein